MESPNSKLERTWSVVCRKLNRPSEPPYLWDSEKYSPEGIYRQVQKELEGLRTKKALLLNYAVHSLGEDKPTEYDPFTTHELKDKSIVPSGRFSDELIWLGGIALPFSSCSEEGLLFASYNFKLHESHPFYLVEQVADALAYYMDPGSPKMTYQIISFLSSLKCMIAHCLMEKPLDDIENRLEKRLRYHDPIKAPKAVLEDLMQIAGFKPITRDSWRYTVELGLNEISDKGFKVLRKNLKGDWSEVSF